MDSGTSGGIVSNYTVERDTKVEVKTISFTYNLPTFATTYDISYRSPEFSPHPEVEPSWNISVLCMKRFPDVIWLTVDMNGEEDTLVRAKFNACLFSNQGVEFKSGWSGVASCRSRSSTVGAAKFVEKDTWHILQRDKWQILCDIKYMSSDYGFFDPSERIREGLSDNLKELLDHKTFSDITILVKGAEFKAHKVILAARSKVFADIFRSGGAKTKYINVTDIDIEPFRELLKFIYTGCVPNLEKFAHELHVAAGNLGLTNLKFVCQEYFAEKNK